MTKHFVRALFVVLGMTSYVSADYFLRFQSSAPVIGGVHQFAVGSVNTVELFLVGTGVDAVTLANYGLVSASLGAVSDPLEPENFPFVAGAVLANALGDASIASVSPNSTIFDMTNQEVIAGSQAAWLALRFGTPTAGNSSVLLGSFDVIAGSTSGDTGTLTLFQDQMDILIGNNTPLSFSGNLSLNFTSNSSVPEPNSMVWLSLAFGGCFATFQRRRLSAGMGSG